MIGNKLNRKFLAIFNLTFIIQGLITLAGNPCQELFYKYYLKKKQQNRLRKRD